MKIEQLKTEVTSIETSLNQLKNDVKLSEDEKKKQAEALKTKVDEAKKKISERINELSDKTDSASKKEVEEGKQLLETLENVVELQREIIEGKKAPEKTGTGGTGGEVATGDGGGTTGEKTGEDEKGVIGKGWDWIKEQWNETTRDNLKKKPGATLLRGAGFVATGVGAIALAYKGIKKLFGRGKDEEGEDNEEVEETTKKKKKKKKKKETSWRKKFLIGAGITAGTAVGGVQVYKHLNKIKGRCKDVLGLNQPFDEARKTVEAQVYAGINKDSAFGAFNADFKGLSYNDNTQMVSSYGEETKIDYKNKKIDGLPVEFPDWEQLLHAANLVNFAKRKMQGRGETERPFNVGKIDGDLGFDAHGQGNEDFVTGSASNFWATLLGPTGAITGGLLGGYFGGLAGAGIGAVGGGATGYVGGSIIDENSTLRKICDTLKANPNLSYFANYLNDLKDSEGKSLWKFKNQKVEQQDKTPLQKYINKLITELNNDYYEEGDNGIRNLKAEMDEKDPEKFRVSSYNGANDNGNNKVCITLKGCKSKQGDVGIDFSKITDIHIEKYQNNDLGSGLNIKFPKTEAGLKEAIRTVNLTNKIRFHYKKKCAEKYPFAYGKYRAHGILQFQKNALDVDTPGHSGDSIVYHDELESQYPTIADDLEEYDTISGLWNATFDNDGEQQRMSKNAQEGTPESKKGSQYIKYLHQMKADENGEDNFWLSKN